MKWVYVSTAYHDHAKNVARALYDDHRLFKWLIPLMYSAESLNNMPALMKLLKHRVICGLPETSIHRHLRWEILRLAISKLNLSRVFLDTIWEKGDFSIDRRASKLLERSEISGVVGFEHGCLTSLKHAKVLGKKCAVVFASVHHSMRERWVDVQYRDHSSWADSSEKVLLARAKIRDERRDLEAECADFIYANSEVTKKSFVEAGFPAEKIIAIPLGIGAKSSHFQPTPSETLRVIYVGAVALHKGFHVLQEAFLKIPSTKIRLDVYGGIRVSHEMLSRSDRIIFHGAVDHETLNRVYAQADILVFPSFSDGFGQAGAEALGYGVPLIVSDNAGISWFIKNGFNGFRVAPGDVNGIKEALQQCLDHRPLLEKMKLAAYETAREWTWEHFRSNWISEFAQRLDRN